MHPMCIVFSAATSFVMPMAAPVASAGSEYVQSSPMFRSTSSTIDVTEYIFPTSDVLAFIQPVGLGAPKASKANPGGAGNAEGNWWTPSSALDTDCEGRPVTSTTVLTQECIYEKKTAEIKARQRMQEQNAIYKVEKLEAAKKKAAADAAKAAARAEEVKARQAKYAGRM
eukprot:CAMPEP_0115866396 /NCGR_PEP_ID=MMETSP0287-20121206/20225_1 /TAXON_ID=412157 /ORGANISM="Chrysochromulina rotalis, Strain UIO044" /LENGTH=169 /DNA_ID=CAMNT_0003320957 /DNA_START=12 /DNA_END=521 /DNA_ORIENTATION=+